MDRLILSENEPRPVRITMTVRQSLVAPLFGFDSDNPPTLFGTAGSSGARDAWAAYRYVEEKSDPLGSDADRGITPEQYPDALEYAIDDMIDRDSDGYGFPPEDTEEEDDDPPESIHELIERIGEILGSAAEDENKEYDDDDLISQTTGVMEKRTLADGSLEISVSYEEVLPMECGR